MGKRYKEREKVAGGRLDGRNPYDVCVVWV